MLPLSRPAFLTSVTFLAFFYCEVLSAKGFIPPKLDKYKYLFLITTAGYWAFYMLYAV